MAFTGQLNPNQIFPELYNMIISQRVYADDIPRSYGELLDRARVDGTLYGDTKLYVATDILKTRDWLGDAEAANLLSLHRPPKPEVQAITMSQFRMIETTVDSYLTKQAWMGEGVFSSFNERQLAWLRDTKYVYDSFLYNTYIGTANSLAAGSAQYPNKQNVTVAMPAEPSTDNPSELNAYNQARAMAIMAKLADLLVELKDITRYYNDYGFMRGYRESDLAFVWNADWINEIRYIDTPTIFHADELKDKLGKDKLPARYFGNINVNAGTTPATNVVIRSMIETDYGSVHVFPGELLPGNVAYEANTTYSEDSTIILKIMHRESVPYMSSFDVSSEFWNPASLTRNNYVIYGHNKLEYLKQFPMITVKAQSA